MGKIFIVLVALCAACGLLLLGSCGGGDGGGTSILMVSVDPAGLEGNEYSTGAVISGDGRYVAFRSAASNLIENDANGVLDIFVRDIQMGLTSRVSVSTAGTEADSNSYNPSISFDGRYVGFASAASNLVADDPDLLDVFVHEMETGITAKVTVSPAGSAGDAGGGGPALNSDGMYVAFRSGSSNLVDDDNNGVRDIFVRDMDSAITARVSVSTAGTEGDGDCWYPAISADGQHVAFYSSSTNLVSDDTNSVDDVFLRDVQGAITSRVSVSTAGTEGDAGSYNPAISSDGLYLAFASEATNLVPDDTNGSLDVFVRDLQGGITSRVSVSTAGIEGDAGSYSPAISSDGRYVVFASQATNLVPDDINGFIDIFVRDLQEGTTSRVSVSAEGVEADGNSDVPAISPDGRYVTFYSEATNLLDGTITSGTSQIYRVRWR